MVSCPEWLSYSWRKMYVPRRSSGDTLHQFGGFLRVEAHVFSLTKVIVSHLMVVIVWTISNKLTSSRLYLPTFMHAKTLAITFVIVEFNIFNLEP